MTAYSDFRLLMDTWDDYCESESQISNLLDGNRLIMFLKRGDDFFGAPEESRLMFAKMKTDDEDEISDDWRKEAKFVALDLMKSISGEPKQIMIGFDDLEKLEVVQREDIIEKLMKALKS